MLQLSLTTWKGQRCALTSLLYSTVKEIQHLLLLPSQASMLRAKQLSLSLSVARMSSHLKLMDRFHRVASTRLQIAMVNLIYTNGRSRSTSRGTWSVLSPNTSIYAISQSSEPLPFTLRHLMAMLTPFSYSKKMELTLQLRLHRASMFCTWRLKVTKCSAWTRFFWKMASNLTRLITQVPHLWFGQHSVAVRSLLRTFWHSLELKLTHRTIKERLLYIWPSKRHTLSSQPIS